MLRTFIAHRGIPEVDAGREIEVLSSVPVVERSCIWPPLPSRNGCIEATARSRSPRYLLPSMDLQLSIFFTYADTSPLQRMGNAGRERAGLKDLIICNRSPMVTLLINSRCTKSQDIDRKLPPQNNLKMGCESLFLFVA